jgi:hypothetical protein
MDGSDNFAKKIRKAGFILLIIVTLYLFIGLSYTMVKIITTGDLDRFIALAPNLTIIAGALVVLFGFDSFKK